MKISQLENVIQNHLIAHLRGVSRSWTDNILGHSGVGKTYLAKQVATANDCVLISISVSELEPADLIGIPQPVQIRPNIFVQRYALPDWLPHVRVDENNKEIHKTFEDGITRPMIDVDLLGAKVENRKELQAKWGDDWKEHVKGAVIFLDEINRAVDDQMKNGIFEFIEKGRLHTYELPWNTYRISAMNPPSNNYFVNEMTEDKAFVGRSIHYILEATVEEWLKWAEKRGIEQSIRDFIAADPKALMEEEDLILLPARRSPRSFEMLHVVKTETDFPKEPALRREMYHGIIGKEYGDSYARHEANSFERMITPEEILFDYQNVRSYLSDMSKERNDYMNMVNQYMLTFLSNEKDARNAFQDENGNINEEVLHNFKDFVLDMYPHSKTFFVRKFSAYPHMNDILAVDTEIYESLFEDKDNAYES